MDPIAIDQPLFLVNSDEIEVAMIAFDEAKIRDERIAIRSFLIWQQQSSDSPHTKAIQELIHSRILDSTP